MKDKQISIIIPVYNEGDNIKEILPEMIDYCKENNRVYIGYDVWIAGGTIIKQGVTIGNGSVIGALSFVNKDVPENSIVIGSPAKVIKQRFDTDTFTKLKETRFWEYDPKEAKLILEKFELKYTSNEKSSRKTLNFNNHSSL